MKIKLTPEQLEGFVNLLAHLYAGFQPKNEAESLVDDIIETVIDKMTSRTGNKTGNVTLKNYQIKGLYFFLLWDGLRANNPAWVYETSIANQILLQINKAEQKNGNKNKIRT